MASKPDNATRRPLPTFSFAALITASTCFAAPQANVGFEQLDPELIGIDFRGSASRTAFTSTQYLDNAGVAAGDFDGDGDLDLFLKGNGDASFTPLNTVESSIAIHGEQRGSAVSDFDLDVRAGIAVAQNGARTKLYRNVSGVPGLRIRLKGTASNTTASGASYKGGVVLR